MGVDTNMVMVKRFFQLESLDWRRFKWVVKIFRGCQSFDGFDMDNLLQLKLNHTSMVDVIQLLNMYTRMYVPVIMITTTSPVLSYSPGIVTVAPCVCRDERPRVVFRLLPVELWLSTEIQRWLRHSHDTRSHLHHHPHHPPCHLWSMTRSTTRPSVLV